MRIPGQAEKASLWFSRALKACKRGYGEEHKNYASCLLNQAAAMKALNKVQSAVDMMGVAAVILSKLENKQPSSQKLSGRLNHVYLELVDTHLTIDESGSQAQYIVNELE